MPLLYDGNASSSRSDRRHAMLSEIEQYQAIQNPVDLPLAKLQVLLTNISAYIRESSKDEESNDASVASEQSEFGDVDDKDLLLAEPNSSDGLSLKRATPSDFDQQVSTKKFKSADDTASVKLAESVLQNVWGFPKFRLKQEQAIARLITGASATVVFPTGGGKSLVYQIPALAFDEYDKHCGRAPGKGLTLVVSPLIALMKDQVDALKKRGVCAAAMDSSQTRNAYLDTSDKLRNEELKLLYVAPERLNNETFVQMISNTKIRLLAIDEAHCISEWGHAFRPDYLKIARFAKEVEAERVLCLTATATPKVVDDICAAFDIDTSEGVFRTTTYRPNLHLIAKSFTSDGAKQLHLKDFFQTHKGPSIVYVQTHEQTETVCAILKNAGFNAHSYHAGMASELRTAVQDKFMSSNELTIVATIAFGMGIDKPNIRNVVHYAIPKSLEGYSQEIGRAGRDGQDSTCMIYLYAGDIRITEEWSRADVPSLRTVRGLVGELLKLHRYAKLGDVIERNLNEQSKDWDIRRTALDLLNAQLELRFGLIRAITSKYSDYKYCKTPLFDEYATDYSKVSTMITKHSRTAIKWTSIDVDTVARDAGVPREEVVRKLQEWNDSGAIELKLSGVINRFKITKTFPQGEAAKHDIITSIYAQIEAKEQSDMARVQQVIQYVTANGCLSRELAKYFSDETSIPSTGCGTCGYCLTKEPVEYLPVGKQQQKGRISDSKIKAILSATKIRDDARFLARVAIGVSSPRVTAEKLGKHAVFGSMADCNFEELVKRFKMSCTE